VSILKESSCTASAEDPVAKGLEQEEVQGEELGDDLAEKRGEGKVVGMNFGVSKEEEEVRDDVLWRVMIGEGAARL
jgi:hypothetical protein